MYVILFCEMNRVEYRMCLVLVVVVVAVYWWTIMNTHSQCAIHIHIEFTICIYR